VTGDPGTRYRDRLQQWEAEGARLDRHFNQLSAVRAILFVAGMVLAWVALARGTPALWWAGIPLLGFAVVALRHERVAAAREEARRGVDWYRAGLARLEGRWAGAGDGGERFRQPDHLYADDLDLFGRGSLFELLCTARTSVGQQTLAAWLLRPAAPPAIRERQNAVRELTGRPAFRDRLALAAGGTAGGSVDAGVGTWGGAAAREVPAWARPAAFASGTANVAAVVGFLWFGLPGPVVVAVLAIGALVAARLRPVVAGVIAAAGRPSRELDLLATLAELLEGESVSAPLLAGLRDRLSDGSGTPASRQIARLHRLIGLLDSRKNQLFLPVAALLLWTTQLGLAIEAWRRRSGPSIGSWVAAVGEYEALAALATFADEHPDHSWPEVIDGPAMLKATAMAHPLLPRAGTVANDLALGDEPALLLVSGSNMSGKSTMLRAAGLNVVLAQAGAPVRAGAMRLSPLAVGASLRTVDSLLEGQSRFYAEIGRLRKVMDLLEGDRPVLFLLDELLSGTNSHDRLIGARAIVRHLVERGAIGMVTTHDLALAEIATALGTRAANVHFEDHLEAGRLAFDYRLRAGVVSRSNALELMRSVGLDV